VDGVGTGFWLIRQIYSTVKRRIENATRERVERAVREEVVRQLQLHSSPGLAIRVETIRVLVREVIVLAVDDGILPRADFPEVAKLARARHALPRASGAAPPQAVIEGLARVVPPAAGISRERVVAMRSELERSLHEQFGEDFETGAHG
jgi:hypothetical protein